MVAHLLTQCQRCGAVLQSFRDAYLTSSYDRAFSRASFAAQLAQIEREEQKGKAAELWDWLKESEHPFRLQVVRGNPLLQTIEFFAHVTKLVRIACRVDVLYGVDLAELALEIALRLPEDQYGPGLVHDCRGQAFSNVGMVKTRAGDLTGAAEALELARRELTHGSGDMLEDAMLGVNTANLLYAIGLFLEGAALLTRVISMFRKVGDLKGVALTLIQQAYIVTHVDPAHAIEIAEEGLAVLIQIDKEGKLDIAELSARHTLARCYLSLGEVEEAGSIVETYTYLYARHSDPQITGDYLWLRGRIALANQAYQYAKRFLDNAANTYMQAHLYFDATLLAIDRIQVRLLLQESHEAISLAKKVGRQLGEWGLTRDSLQLWASLVNAVADGTFLTNDYPKVISSHLRATWIPRPCGVKFEGGTPSL
ncbi:MAG TPA: hypothetical protein VF173_19505 [Thermoanaerobaculia bacterium]|nr:hypothetical protein [Thermoanaerobaculia bacterium]